MGHSEIPWSAADLSLAAAVWDEFPDSARALFSVLIDNPGHRFSGNELAEMLNRPNSQSVAAVLSRPKKLAARVNRSEPWHWDYPSAATVVYWMTRTQADLFRAARADTIGARTPLAEMIAARHDTVITTNPDVATVREPVVQIGVDDVPLEAVNAEGFEVQGVAAVEACRTEAALADRFQHYLAAANHRVRRFRIDPDGTSAFIYSDLADVTGKVLYEAKGSADRMAVRLALGQVLDYGRYVLRLVPDMKLATLLPEHPANDMVELLEAHDVGCVVELASGTFVDLTSLERCP